MSGIPEVAWRRPVQPSLTQYDTWLLLRRVHTDARYRELKTRARVALDRAIEERVGADGWFWWSREKWSAATGLSKRTLDRAITDLLDVGLLTKQSYRRPPDGTAIGGKTSTPNFRLDPALLAPTGDATVARPVEAATQDATVARPVAAEESNGGVPTGHASLTRRTGHASLARQERRRRTTSTSSASARASEAPTSEEAADEVRAFLAELDATNRCAVPPSGPQQHFLLDALLEAPDGFRVVVEKSIENKKHNPLAFLMWAVGQGVHLQEQTKHDTEPKAKRRGAGSGGGAKRSAKSKPGRGNRRAPEVERIFDDCLVHGRCEHIDDGVNVPRCVECAKAEVA